MHRPKIDRVSTGTLTCSRQPKPCASAQLQPPELAREVQRPSTLRGAAGSGGLVADMRCFPFRVVWSRHVWSYPTFPPPIQSELFDTDSESDPAQNKCRALSSPPPPKRPCGIRAYKTPARPRWGLCFCVSGGRLFWLPSIICPTAGRLFKVLKACNIANGGPPTVRV
jgi:hypothetical protein